MTTSDRVANVAANAAVRWGAKKALGLVGVASGPAGIIVSGLMFISSRYEKKAKKKLKNRRDQLNISTPEACEEAIQNLRSYAEEEGITAYLDEYEKELADLKSRLDTERRTVAEQEYDTFEEAETARAILKQKTLETSPILVILGFSFALLVFFFYLPKIFKGSTVSVPEASTVRQTQTGVEKLAWKDVAKKNIPEPVPEISKIVAVPEPKLPEIQQVLSNRVENILFVNEAHPYYWLKAVLFEKIPDLHKWYDNVSKESNGGAQLTVAFEALPNQNSINEYDANYYRLRLFESYEDHDSTWNRILVHQTTKEILIEDYTEENKYIPLSSWKKLESNKQKLEAANLSTSETSFNQGLSDRQRWETWVATLGGSCRSGVDFWASHRSLKNPGSCKDGQGTQDADYRKCCNAAKEFLAPIDQLRKSDQNYRRGFKSYEVVKAESKASLSVPTPSEAVESPKSESFNRGLSDRQRWEAWVATLSGSCRNGVDFWASHRSLKTPGSCKDAQGAQDADYRKCCKAAKEFLTPIDLLRKTDQDYRQGFKSY